MSEAPLSDGEILLRTHHGRCGHRRQDGLPCASPDCIAGRATGVWADGDGRLWAGKERTGLRRRLVRFGDEEHHVWEQDPEEETG